MLARLRIRNLAIIEELTLDLEEGLTVLLAEQNLQVALDLSDRGYLLDNGVIHFQASAALFTGMGANPAQNTRKRQIP